MRTSCAEKELPRVIGDDNVPADVNEIAARGFEDEGLVESDAVPAVATMHEKLTVVLSALKASSPWRAVEPS